VKRRAKRNATPTRAERNIKWIEKYCRVPEGKFIGRAVKLREWQRTELRKIYDNPKGTRRAIISFARKNGKTALAAFLLLLHLCGPEHRPNSQLFSAAQSRDQAALLFGLAAKCVRLSPDLNNVVIVRDTAKQLLCAELGTIYRALSAEASTAYGLSPSFIVHDELGQVRGPRSELYEALETATGAQDQPLSIIISTQAATDADLLSVLIDDALAAHDPRVAISLYTAPVELDPFSDEALTLANPALGDFLNATEVRSMAEDARRMPSREAEYRNLVLNQRVEASAPFVTRTVWKACGAPIGDLANVPVFAGLDLSSTTDLTALVLIGRIAGKWHVQPTFWLPRTGLEEKSRTDRVPYDMWHKQGFLQAADGKTVDYEFVAGFLWKQFARYDIRKIGFDAWNFGHFKPWLLRAGISEKMIDDRFVEFRQDYKTMSPALRDLEVEIKESRLAHGDHPVLAMCASNAVVVTDTSENKKLAKNKSPGRIDGMVALAMAFGVATAESEREPPKFQFMVL
jgi:phage terminase large subunit-like protein